MSRLSPKYSVGEVVLFRPGTDADGYADGRIVDSWSDQVGNWYKVEDLLRDRRFDIHEHDLQMEA